MLTEADMNRILAEKYSFTESAAEVSNDAETLDLFVNDEPFEALDYDISILEATA